MLPLYDADVLRYQIGFAAEAYWRALNEERWIEREVVLSQEEKDDFFINNPPSFDIVQDMVDNRIGNCNAIVGADKPAIMYFTGRGNFRNEICTTGYKLRAGYKPYHYHNITAYLKGMYEWYEVDGLEADDLLAIRAMEDPENTIIISIDKDLLQVPCHHYSFEFGNVPSFGPIKVDGYGEIWKDKTKLRGYGTKFFLSQCITGDPVDSIIGIPKSGPVAALKVLEATTTYAEGLEAVKGAYKAFYEDEWEEKLIENARLLWMIRELDAEGKPIMWEIDNVDY